MATVTVDHVGLSLKTVIKSAKKHFAEIGIDDYEYSVPKKWNL